MSEKPKYPVYHCDCIICAGYPVDWTRVWGKTTFNPPPQAPRKNPYEEFADAYYRNTMPEAAPKSDGEKSHETQGQSSFNPSSVVNNRRTTMPPVLGAPYNLASPYKFTGDLKLADDGKRGLWDYAASMQFLDQAKVNAKLDKAAQTTENLPLDTQTNSQGYSTRFFRRSCGCVVFLMNPLLGKSWSEAQVRLVKSCAASVVGDDANGEISITPQRLYVDTDAPEPLTLDEENTLLNQMADLIKYGYAARRFTEDVQTFLRGKHQ